MARDRMYDLVVEVVEEFKGELIEYLSRSNSEIESRYLIMLINGYNYKFERKFRKGVSANFEGSKEEYRDFVLRLDGYIDEVRKLWDRINESVGGYGSDVIPEYLKELDGRKVEFEYPEEYVLYMRTFLGNAGFREDAVRKHRVKLWRVMFDALGEVYYRPFDYVLMRNLISEVEKCLVWNSNLKNVSDLPDTWHFRSMMSNNPELYEKKKKDYLAELVEQADSVIEMFSEDRV